MKLLCSRFWTISIYLSLKFRLKTPCSRELSVLLMLLYYVYHITNIIKTNNPTSILWLILFHWSSLTSEDLCHWQV